MIYGTKKNDSLIRKPLNGKVMSEIEFITVKELSKSYITVNIDYDNINNPQNIIYYVTGLEQLDVYLNNNQNISNNDFFYIMNDICKNYIQCELNNNVKLEQLGLNITEVYIDPINNKTRFLYNPFQEKKVGLNNSKDKLKTLLLNILNRYELRNRIKESIASKINKYLVYEFDDIYKFIEFINNLSSKCKDNKENIDNKNKQKLSMLNNRYVGILITICIQVIVVFVSIHILESNWSLNIYPIAIFVIIILLDISMTYLAIEKIIFKQMKEENNQDEYNSINIFDIPRNNRLFIDDEMINETTIINESYKTEDKITSDTVLLNEIVIQPYLINDKNEKIYIDKDEFIIGRYKGKVDLCIINNTVGKQHAKILISNEEIYIIDLNSKNGTFINNKRIRPMDMVKVNDGDYITLSNVRFTFKSR